MSELNLDQETLTTEELDQVKQKIIISKMSDYQEHPESENDHEFSDQEAGKLLTKITMAEISYRIEDKIETIETGLEEIDWESEDIHEISQKTISAVEIYEDLVLFYNLVTEYVSELSIEFLRNELFKDKYASSNKTETLLRRRLSQSEREEFLLRTGLIEEGLKSELSHIRSLRNDLIHEFAEPWIFSNIDNIVSEIHRAISAYNQLEYEVYGEEIVAGMQLTDE